ncbi:M24 family metallopeptidase [Paenibacillus sp. CC-CFT747]|nr:M24 family metallopeptidase [Paenibacillus sp. CC-CFT747]
MGAYRLGTDFFPPGTEGSGRHDLRALLLQMRRVKAPYEFERIREAGRLNEACYKAVRASLSPAIDEFDLYHRMSLAAWRHVGEPAALEGKYDLLTGPRTYLAGGVPVPRRLAQGDLVLVDLFPSLNGYHADNCRTYCLGEPTVLQERAYRKVMEALKVAESGLKPGIRVSELFREVDAVLAEIGFGYTLLIISDMESACGIKKDLTWFLRTQTCWKKGWWSA